MKSYQSANERGELLLDHVIITVKDLDRAIAFYETALKPLGIVHAIDYDHKDGPEGLPTSRVSDGTAAYSSGSGRAMRTPRLRISDSSPERVL
jgi:catechol 2,3-dioxygenase-like lactoylglutathione lyase family enzyme